MLVYVGVPKLWRRFVQLQVLHKLCCAPVLLEIGGGGTCYRQLYGAGAYDTV